MSSACGAEERVARMQSGRRETSLEADVETNNMAQNQPARGEGVNLHGFKNLEIPVERFQTYCTATTDPRDKLPLQAIITHNCTSERTSLK